MLPLTVHMLVGLNLAVHILPGGSDSKISLSHGGQYSCVNNLTRGHMSVPVKWHHFPQWL